MSSYIIYIYVYLYLHIISCVVPTETGHFFHVFVQVYPVTGPDFGNNGWGNTQKSTRRKKKSVNVRESRALVGDTADGSEIRRSPPGMVLKTL